MKLRHFAVPIALASALFLGSSPLMAQAHAPAPQTEAAAASEGAHASPGHEPTTGAEGGSHHGPEVKLFGFPLSQVGQFTVRVANFAIFFAILYFILKGALSSAFKARTKELEEQLAQAERDKEEGEAQLKELEARMAGMQAELAGIMTKSESEAEIEKQKVIEAARSEADQILAQTQAEIEFQKRQAERELRALVAELAIEGAAKRLEARVQGTVAEQVLDRAIQEVGGVK